MTIRNVEFEYELCSGIQLDITAKIAFVDAGKPGDPREEPEVIEFVAYLGGNEVCVDALTKRVAHRYDNITYTPISVDIDNAALEELQDQEIDHA